MNKGLIYITFLIACCLVSCGDKQQTSASMNEIEANFKNIPASVQTSVYWYWINGNISKEGVVKDLHAMKEAGINRAFIGNIGDQQGIPHGPVKLFTDEWWEIMHTALKTATELDIEPRMESVGRSVDQAGTGDALFSFFRTNSARS